MPMILLFCFVQRRTNERTSLVAQRGSKRPLELARCFWFNDLGELLLCRSLSQSHWLSAVLGAGTDHVAESRCIKLRVELLSSKWFDGYFIRNATFRLRVAHCKSQTNLVSKTKDYQYKWTDHPNARDELNYHQPCQPS